MKRNEIDNWLQEENESILKNLWQHADQVRKENVGDDVHLRGLIEISNHCDRTCSYCGINKLNTRLARYRMNENEILYMASLAAELSYGTIVLQSGEDYGIKTEWLSKIIKEVKLKTGVAVTLSLGERSESDLTAWKDAGADRYLLKFETSDSQLYDSIHPPLNHNKKVSRIKILKNLRKIGYEIGSGIMVGIPGQTYETLADDIELFKDLDLDMIGIGPYIPHPSTILGENRDKFIKDKKVQVPNSEEMSLKVLALSRIACPEANIPSTTALGTINKEKGRENGLLCGANILMPNITPSKYRKLYDIYPEKSGKNYTPLKSDEIARQVIQNTGRNIGKGAGFRRRATLS